MIRALQSNLVHVGFGAERRLMELKGQAGMLPSSVVEYYIARVDDSLPFIDVVHQADCLPDPTSR